MTAEWCKKPRGVNCQVSGRPGWDRGRRPASLVSAFITVTLVLVIALIAAVWLLSR